MECTLSELSRSLESGMSGMCHDLFLGGLECNNPKILTTYRDSNFWKGTTTNPLLLTFFVKDKYTVSYDQKELLIKLDSLNLSEFIEDNSKMMLTEINDYADTFDSDPVNSIYEELYPKRIIISERGKIGIYFGMRTIDEDHAFVFVFDKDLRRFKEAGSEDSIEL